MWSIFGVALYAELTVFCMPDWPTRYYVHLYLVGIFLPILVRSIAYLTNTWDETTIHLASAIIGLPFTIVMTSIHAYYHDQPSPPLSEDNAIMYQRYLEATQLIAGDTPTELCYYDIYNASMVPEDGNRGEEGPSISKGRRLWSTIQSTVPRPSLSQPLTTIHRPSMMEGGAVINQLHSADSSPGLSDSAPTSSSAPSDFSKETEALPTSSCSPFSRMGEMDGGVMMKSIPSALLLLLPKFYFQHFYRQSSGFVIHNNLHQAFYIALFFLASNSYFYILMYFLHRFQHSPNTTDLLLTFLIFIALASAMRFLLKRAGMSLDRNKVGSISIFFVAEFLGLMFFYTFYRLVFESVDSWSIFLLIQFFHLLWEWISYPLRASRWLYPYLLYVQSILPIASLRYAFVPKDTNYQDWLDFFAVDFGIRVIVMISTGVGISLLLITIQFVPWIDSGLEEERDRDIWKSVQFILVAVVLEGVNAWAMNVLFFKRQQADVMEKTLRLFQDARFALIVVIIAVNLFINPIYAWTNDNKFHYSS